MIATRRPDYPVCCGIVPPHLVAAIAERGSRTQRGRALATLQVDDSLRSARVGSSSRRLRGRRLRRSTNPAWLRTWRQRVGAPDDKTRRIYDSENSRRLPGTLVLSEGGSATGDDAVYEAYDFLGDTFDLYWNAYGRDSIDDADLPLVGSVHYGEDYDNAFWNGEQMVFGDGDGELFNRFTVSVDVIGHELTHGVTEMEAGLIYWSQAG